MRSLAAVAVAAAAVLLCSPGIARAQQADEPDPCAEALGMSETGACWARESDRAEADLRDAYDALLRKLPPAGAEALRKSQKAWQDWREAQLALLFAMGNPGRVHRWEDTICGAIARRELTRQRARALKRLAAPAKDEACPL